MRGVRAATAVLAGLVLAGCAAIPTSGPVQVGSAQVDEVAGVGVVPEGPIEGASSRRIVEGFLLAQAAGLTGDFQVAREFLAPDQAEEWEPLAGATVADWTYDQTSDSQIRIVLRVVGKVDQVGQFTEVSGGEESVTMNLVEVDGEWRIVDAPPGLIISQRVFDQQYRRAPVYFLSPDMTMLVPDVRYFPTRNLATSVVLALLDGPSDWLRDSVTSAIPEGAALRPEAVRVDDKGVAHVVLEPEQAVSGAPDRGLMLAQIMASLAVPTVSDVEVRAGQGGPLLTGPTNFAEPKAATPVMISDDALVTIGADLSPVEDVGSLAGLDAWAPAVSDNGTFAVALAGPDQLVALPTSDEPARPLLTGPGLARPSADRFGWAWTATSAAGSGLRAVDGAREPVELRPAWLDKRVVTALRVSRDGTRVVVVSTGSEGLAIEVAGVVRDARGAPTSIGLPIQVGAGVDVADQVVWMDSSTVVVLGRTGDSTAITLVPVTGISQPLSSVSDAVSIAADRSDRSIMVATVDGSLLRFHSRTWVPVPVDQPVEDPTYPG